MLDFKFTINEICILIILSTFASTDNMKFSNLYLPCEWTVEWSLFIFIHKTDKVVLIYSSSMFRLCIYHWPRLLKLKVSSGSKIFTWFCLKDCKILNAINFSIVVAKHWTLLKRGNSYQLVNMQIKF